MFLLNIEIHYSSLALTQLSTLFWFFSDVCFHLVKVAELSHVWEFNNKTENDAIKNRQKGLKRQAPEK